jgi:DNA-binding CsgD family transcriptional regulator
MINQYISEVFPCYAKDKAGLYVSMNQDFLDVSVLGSANDVIGYTDEAMPWAYNAATLMDNDQCVIKTEKKYTYFEKSVFQGKPHYFRSTKSPLIGNMGKILGVQCVSFPVSDHCLIPLTKQQTACLKELALGFTHKQIGQTLGLAQKTVEHYLDAVKLKLNCKTRSELIMQAIERGLVWII